MIIDGRIGTTVQRRLKLDEVVDGLLQYVGNMTDGKVLIMPHGTERIGRMMTGTFQHEEVRCERGRRHR